MLKFWVVSLRFCIGVGFLMSPVSLGNEGASEGLSGKFEPDACMDSTDSLIALSSSLSFGMTMLPFEFLIHSGLGDETSIGAKIKVD